VNNILAGDHNILGLAKARRQNDPGDAGLCWPTAISKDYCGWVRKRRR